MDDPLNGVVQALLDQLNAGFPRVENMTGPQARAAVAERRMPVNNLDDVRSATDREVPGPDGAVPVRIYEPHGAPSRDRAAVVFYHGGGFVFCDIESHDGFCRALARAPSRRCLGRLPPGPRASRPGGGARRVRGVPLGGDHAADLGIDPARTMVAGDSAGGNLAAVTAILCRDRGVTSPAAQLLIYPAIDPSFDTDSYRRYATGYFNTRAAMQWYWHQYLGAQKVFDPPYLVAPARADPRGSGARGDRDGRARSPAQRGLRLRAPVAPRGSARGAPGLSGAVPRLHDDPGVSAGGVGTAFDLCGPARTAAFGGSERGVVTKVSDVIVIGAGFAGLYAVYRAVSSGLSVTAIEAAPDVGGTWYWNRYPGARCDVESVDYSYSFDEGLQQSWQWTERFAAQPEILAYLRHVADRFDLRRHYRFGVDAVGATFERGRWHVDTATGDAFAAQFLLCATGCLSAVNRPNIPGAEDFSRRGVFHAAWPREDPDLRGKRVGLIGTGSSGIQVAPIIAAHADHLVVFQRSANYTIPMPNRPWSVEEQREIQEQYPERRRTSRVCGGGHTARHLPQECPRHRHSRASRSAVEALARRRRAVRQDLPRPDQRPGRQRRRQDVCRGADPGDRRRSRRRNGSHPGRSPDRNQTDLHRRRLLRHLQPRQCSAGQPAPRAHRSDHRRRRTNHRATYPCDVLVFATGFDAMTGALTRSTRKGLGDNGCAISGPTAR